jgi:hypothetical protein
MNPAETALVATLERLKADPSAPVDVAELHRVVLAERDRLLAQADELAAAWPDRLAAIDADVEARTAAYLAAGNPERRSATVDRREEMRAARRDAATSPPA